MARSARDLGAWFFLAGVFENTFLFFISSFDVFSNVFVLL